MVLVFIALMKTSFLTSIDGFGLHCLDEDVFPYFD